MYYQMPSDIQGGIIGIGSLANTIDLLGKKLVKEFASDPSYQFFTISH